MLKVRVIPTLLWKDLGLVKGVAFDSWRRVGTALPAVKVYNLREVDELMLLDITATKEAREPDYEFVSGLASECFVPFTVGGGIRNLEHIRGLLLAGADKVCINTAAYNNKDFIRASSSRFGSQCIVVSIDCKHLGSASYNCYSESGTQRRDIEPAQWAQEMEACGAGEILITSIDRDGTMAGCDLDLIKQVTSAVKIPVIAAGGVGSYNDMFQAISEAKASAIAAASIFHFTESTPLEAKRYLAERGIPVRNSARMQSELTL